MKTEEIIEMARQAGANVHFSKHHIAFIEAFAKLVEARTAAKEREACAKVCDDIDKSHWGCEIKATWCSEAIRARSGETK